MKTSQNSIFTVARLTIVLVFLLGFKAIGQQLYYSQYQLTPMLNNPSLISLSEEIKVDFGYRNQFGGKGSNYSTPLVAGQMPIYNEVSTDVKRKVGAAGIQILNDRTGYSGLLSTTGFSITYAHIARLSRSDWFSFGLQPGFYQRRVDYSKLTSGNQWDAFMGAYDPSLPLNENISATERRSFLTINAGMTYVRESANGDPFFTISLGANNLSRPNVSLNAKSYSNPVNWNFQSSIVAFEDEQFIVKPTVRHIQIANTNQTNIGSYGYYKLNEAKGFLGKGNIGLGLWYSNQNSIVTALEINQKDWALGFSYDFLVSSLAQVQNSTGAPEIVVGFRKYIGRKKSKADLSASGDMKGDGGTGGIKETKKPVQPEISKEAEAKPAVPAVPTPEEQPKPKVEEPTAPVDNQPGVDKADPNAKETKTLRDKQNQGAKATTPGKKPVVKPGTKSAAKPATPSGNKPTVSPAKKPAAKPAPVSRKSNLSPELAKKMANLRTDDGYLGNDPYKGTPLELKPNELDFFKQQPRFDIGSAGNTAGYEIDGIAKAQLDQMAALMKSRPKIRLEIGGFGCDMGGPEVTKQISQGRAESVRRYLISKGIPANRLEAVGYGVANPMGDNSTDDGKVMNRRVQFKFIP